MNAFGPQDVPVVPESVHPTGPNPCIYAWIIPSSKKENSPLPLFDGLLGLAIEGALTQGLALVVELFSPGQRDFHLDPTALDHHRQRHYRQTLFAHLGGEALDLALVEQ